MSVCLSVYVCLSVCPCTVSGVSPAINRCELRAASDVITHVVTSSPITVSYVRTDTLTMACDVTGVPQPTYDQCRRRLTTVFLCRQCDSTLVI